MRTTKRIRTGVSRAAVALMAVLVVSAVATPRAHAIDVQSVISAAKTAHSAYQALQRNEITLQQATDRIIGAINGARTDITNHIDRVATAELRACANDAVDGLVNFNRFTTDTKQAFARDSSFCLRRIESMLSTINDKPAADQLGVAANAVGPAALIAFAHVNFDPAPVRSTLRSVNNTLVTKLAPSCQASPLYGDAVPGGWVEVMLRCRAHNGDLGYDTAFSRDPRRDTFDFTRAANQATRNTSRAVAQAVLPTL
jgi:hypothetical protein